MLGCCGGGPTCRLLSNVIYLVTISGGQFQLLDFQTLQSVNGLSSLILWLKLSTHSFKRIIADVFEADLDPGHPNARTQLLLNPSARKSPLLWLWSWMRLMNAATNEMFQDFSDSSSAGFLKLPIQFITSRPERHINRQFAGCIVSFSTLYQAHLYYRP